jgi:hypothetical protein
MEGNAGSGRVKTGHAVSIVGILALLVLGAAAFYRLGIVPQRHEAEDRSVRLWEIRAAAEQFFLENPDRVFVEYKDLVGPGSPFKSLNPVSGEDYKTLFPLRIDFGALAVTMRDGRQVIVMPDGALLQRDPKGRIRGAAEEIERYQASLGKVIPEDKIQIVKLPNGARLEIAYHGGRPHGKFRAIYNDGKLWAEGIYENGRPAGKHTVFDRNGKIIFETTFVP